MLFRSVQLVDDVDTAPVAQTGSLIENHPRFAQRVNAGYLQIISRAEVRLRDTVQKSLSLGAERQALLIETLGGLETLKACGEQNVKIAQIMSTAATRGNANESVYCATKWGEKGYTKSLQAAYKGTSVKVVAIYPGGIDTAFYRDSHDYVSEDKQHTFMQPGPLAEVILFNLINEANLTVTDIEINRNS